MNVVMSELMMQSNAAHEWGGSRSRSAADGLSNLHRGLYRQCFAGGPGELHFPALARFVLINVI